MLNGRRREKANLKTTTRRYPDIKDKSKNNDVMVSKAATKSVVGSLAKVTEIVTDKLQPVVKENRILKESLPALGAELTIEGMVIKIPTNRLEISMNDGKIILGW